MVVMEEAVSQVVIPTRVADEALSMYAEFRCVLHHWLQHVFNLLKGFPHKDDF